MARICIFLDWSIRVGSMFFSPLFASLISSPICGVWSVVGFCTLVVCFLFIYLFLLLIIIIIILLQNLHCGSATLLVGFLMILRFDQSILFRSAYRSAYIWLYERGCRRGSANTIEGKWNPRGLLTVLYFSCRQSGQGEVTEDEVLHYGVFLWWVLMIVRFHFRQMWIICFQRWKHWEACIGIGKAICDSFEGCGRTGRIGGSVY